MCKCLNMDQFGGGNWNMIPTISNPTTPSSTQDHLYIQQQQFQQQQRQQFQQQQQQFQLPQQQQQSYKISQQQQPPPPPQQPSQSLASHFLLQNLVENLADAIENGTRDQHFDTLVTELSNHFEKCQQLLNTISGSIASKAATVEGQKHKVEEAEQMLNQRRDVIAKYRNSVDEVTKPDIY
ncbi:mediator of RNA polymerase II transcription subunit 9-like [Rutidosis leptorrhynchoides]|uniref:mediator of RNA polymerase II transcription subunit 9-like n=1 Tax=Rutidosis leptorrhynchoides TaxID=125765 RepID=UPI003A98FEA5